ncbi:hypothetical protein J1N35_031285 [Gossypium stocksii]|uniref:Uncharacterized protein n=1 Tax=Gossypium stocksii TaxID=47602 RepID=A0A9D3V1I8_9ROSI|nr:hypothetical protein J1N35_031285 [Gossypium stocksii]
MMNRRRGSTGVKKEGASYDGVMVPPGTPPPPPPPHQHPAFPSVPSPHQPAFPSPTPHHPNTLYLKQQNGMIAA